MDSQSPGHPLLNDLFSAAVRLAVSDVHLAADSVSWCRTGGQMTEFTDIPMTSQADLESISRSLLEEQGLERLARQGSCDGACSHEGTRFRFNIFQCSGKLSIAFRILENEFRTLEELGLPVGLQDICDLKDGLILVAGPTGSGKSTTLASLVNRINETRQTHIVTIEDPVEYIHQNKRSLVSQRQVGFDTSSFHIALTDALRQDPDVLLVGEMRDLETIRTAVMAAETGHLVFATVHAGDCASAIDRIISVFPGNEQALIRNLVAGSLRTVIAQHLLVAESPLPHSGADHRSSKNRVLASEILHVNSAAGNLIASDNVHQLQSIMETHRSEGMQTLDSSLARLWRVRKISEATARSIARNPNMLRELSRAI